MTQDPVLISLTRYEALVLFEWLASLGETTELKLDEAEQTVIWRLEGRLESVLTEVLVPDYKERLMAAKKVVLGVE